MIILTRLHGQQFALNPDLVERIEATPDTVLLLVGGGSYVVAEPPETVIGRIRDFRASIAARAGDPSILDHQRGNLRVVEDR